MKRVLVMAVFVLLVAGCTPDAVEDALEFEDEFGDLSDEMPYDECMDACPGWIQGMKDTGCFDDVTDSEGDVVGFVGAFEWSCEQLCTADCMYGVKDDLDIDPDGTCDDHWDRVYALDNCVRYM